jgi:hypothetical protein
MFIYIVNSAFVDFGNIQDKFLRCQGPNFERLVHSSTDNVGVLPIMNAVDSSIMSSECRSFIESVQIPINREEKSSISIFFLPSFLLER